MKKHVTVLFLAALLGGCAAAPTAQDGRKLTVEDAGEPPANVEQAIADAMRYRLKDPDSAKYQVIGKPWRQVTNKTMITNGGAGWAICFEVNAKNIYGAYTGYTRTYMLWNSGRVVEYLDGDYGEIACKSAG